MVHAHETVRKPGPIASSPEGTAPLVERTFVLSRPLLQRACACSAGAGGCACNKKKGLQAKLELGAPGDGFEQEADRVADSIGHASAAPPRIQRVASPAAPSHDAPATDNVENVIATPGRPLDRTVRQEMEQGFGRDFSRVRVHTGGLAERSARDVGALAYTVGEHIVFGAGRFAPSTSSGRHLLAHELTHVVQQSGGSDVVQRAGDPAAIPPGFPCPPDPAPGVIAGTSLLFGTNGSAIDAGHTAALTTFVGTWTTGGGTDDVVVHGYASEDGDQTPNWILSCNRAEAVRGELIRLGLPAFRVTVVAHGEATDYGSQTQNRRVVVTSRAGGAAPIIGGILTPVDNFAGRSTTQFGVAEGINLSFASTPPLPATAFGGLQWRLVSGGGALTAVLPDGTARYDAPATAATVVLELRVASGATAGRVVSTHTITIVIPSGVHITEVPGTSPNFRPGGTIPPGTWGAGFLGNVFAEPRGVSFQGVVFGEGSVAAVVTPAGSFLSSVHGRVHAANTFGAAHGGNAATGTAISPPSDQISGSGFSPTIVLGVPTCGTSDFLWAIPWEFQVGTGPRTPFTTADHHMTSTVLCDATIEKGGAGPFRRAINT